MQLLKSIRIVNYRSIIEEKVELTNIVTLIGANESGKTNILKAIEHLSKDQQKKTFDFNEINLCFANSTNNKIEIEYEIILQKQLFPKLSVYLPALINKTILLKKTGSPQNNINWEINVPHLSNISNLIYISGNKNEFRKQLKANSFTKEQIADFNWIDDKQKFFLSSSKTNLSKNPFRSMKQEGVISVLTENEKNNKIKELLLEQILNNIQIYFWKYDLSNYLPETIKLVDFCERPNHNKSILGIFKIAYDEGKIDFEPTVENLNKYLIETSNIFRSNLLNDITNAFNKIFRKAWKTYFGTNIIKLLISYEDDNLFFRLDDGRQCPPQYRSDGLKWFLTFLINFQSKQKDLSKYILIMDEPGGFLHPQGQKDALKFLLKLSEKNQVIYSTHQTFLIDKNCPENVRILNRMEKDRIGFWPTHVYQIKNHHEHILKDFLLRESLGFTLSDISPINEYNVLVEGTFDRNVLQKCNEKFQILDMNITSIIYCGKATNIKYSAQQYLENGLKVLCVYDYDQAGKNAYDKSGLNEKNKILIGEKGETIEDLLPGVIFKGAMKRLLKDNKFKKYFVEGSNDIKTPFISNTFVKQLNEDGKKNKNDIKHKLEDFMLDEIKKKINTEDFNKIEELLKKINSKLSTK